MRKFLLIIILLISFNGKAQSWFNSGTTLHRPYHIDFHFPGYIKYTSNGTVTVNSLTCQQILAETKCIYMGNLATITNSYNIVTHYNNGLVTRHYPTTNTFDTIYNFNAVVGDQWCLSPKSYTNCAKSKVIVTAVGTKTIQGVALKWLKVTINGYTAWNTFPNVYNDTIIERMGSKANDFLSGFNLCAWVSDGSYGQWIRCYSDNQITNYKTNIDTNQCNFFMNTVSISEESMNTKDIIIYPNPANDYIVIKHNQMSSKFTAIKFINIFNYSGQLLLRREIKNDESLTIRVGSYPKGIYFLKLIDEDSKTHTQKLIVE